MSIWIPIVILLMAGSFFYYMMQKNRSILFQPKDVEKTLQEFVEEITEQNDLLLQTIHDMEEKIETKVRHFEDRIRELENLIGPEQTNNNKDSSPHVTNSNEEYNKAGMQDLDGKDILALKNRYQRIFQLYQNGLTSDEIAKAVGSGKGEVEFILRLSKME